MRGHADRDGRDSCVVVESKAPSGQRRSSSFLPPAAVLQGTQISLRTGARVADRSLIATIAFSLEPGRVALLPWRPSATSAGVGASRDCSGLLTPVLLLGQVRRHQAGPTVISGGDETNGAITLDVPARLVRAAASTALSGAIARCSRSAPTERSRFGPLAIVARVV